MFVLATPHYNARFVANSTAASLTIVITFTDTIVLYLLRIVQRAMISTEISNPTQLVGVWYNLVVQTSMPASPAQSLTLMISLPMQTLIVKTVTFPH